MRNKVREFLCLDEDGQRAVVVEWRIQPAGTHSDTNCCQTYALEDGSPVSPLAGRFEHFYSGKLFTPV